MEARLSFTFTEQEVYSKEPEKLLNGSACRRALFEFDEWIRGKIKHEDKDWQEIRDQFWVIVKENEAIID